MVKKNHKDGRRHNKPPEHSRFKPGQSGNLKGRPKKSNTFQQDVNEVLNAKVLITVNGKKTYITKRKLLIERVVNEVIENPKMVRIAMPLIKMGDNVPEFEVLPEDTKALLDLLNDMGGEDEH